MSIEGLIAKKLGMTEFFREDGRCMVVTVLETGPCRVVLKRTKERDGYEAIQVSFGEAPEKKLNRPQLGHFKKSKTVPSRILREFKGDLAALEVGAVVKADLFQKGERVDLTGITKGKGFQGVMKRHNFAGGPESHGSMFHRAPGSIGASSFPSRVWKNQRMPGHMGMDRMTIQNLEVVEVRPDENLVFICGAVPGGEGSLVTIRKRKAKK